MKSVALWADGAPHQHGELETDTPRLCCHLPERRPTATPAVIICPGGGYEMLALQHEGFNVADWFRERGVAACVLVYRLPSDSYLHPVPLLDAQRAVRLVRSQSSAWNIRPDRIAIMGFSAGGHLASSLLTHFDGGNALAPDPVDRQSCRPDFGLLVYPVITFTIPGVTHTFSKARLLGPGPSPELVVDLSNEKQVTSETPPTLLVHAEDDMAVRIQNSEAMLAALEAKGVSCALHRYPHGGHGFGYGLEGSTAPPQWLERVGEWLGQQGFVAADA